MTEKDNWREEYLAESARISELAKSPVKINRIGKTRRTECEGGCGARTWDEYCRKCRRKMGRDARKRKRK